MTTTITILSRVGAYVDVLHKGTKSVAAAEAALAKAHGGLLQRLAETVAGCEAISAAEFDQSVAPALRGLLSAEYEAGSLTTMLDRHKMVILGTVHGFAITEEDTNAAKYAKRVRELLKAKGAYVPKTGSNGGRKAADPSEAVTVPVTKGEERVAVSRDVALRVLCGTDKARQQALDEALRNHADAFWQAVNALLIADTKKAA